MKVYKTLWLIIVLINQYKDDSANKSYFERDKQYDEGGGEGMLIRSEINEWGMKCTKKECEIEDSDTANYFAIYIYIV